MSRYGTAGADTGRRRIVLVPGRDDLVDAGVLLVLMVLALVGFRTTYAGTGYLVAGVLGTVLGLLIAHLANVLRQPMIALAAMTLAVFFLAGGAVALHSSPVGGVLPTGSTLHVLSDETVHGWKDLLTTLPPVDGSGPLLVLPYLLGLLGGVGGFALARRTRPSAAPVSAPLAVLVAVILLGTQSPAARLVQGAVFGVVALGWITVRAQRRRPPVSSGAGRRTRLVTVAALFAVSFAGAALVGPHVPGAHAHDRTVLRSYVDPPFDVGQYPSPLAGFRKYTKQGPAAVGNLYSKPLFTVQGLPAGTLIRIATLDDYDGLAWRAANRSADDTFQRVGTDIDDPARGRAASFEVTVDAGYTDVWLPDAGALTRLQFSGPHARSHGDFFRYNLATGTGVVPDRLTPGDSFRGTAVLPVTGQLTPQDPVAANSADTTASAFLHKQADEWSGSGDSTAGRILQVAKHLRDVGSFSDGTAPFQQYLAGHSQARLTTFVGGPQIVGDGEQYAAALALMIQQIGAPARVVLGAPLGGSHVVRGSDVQAWVEVQLTDGSWRTLLPDTFMNRLSVPKKTTSQVQQPKGGKIVPPPTRSRPRSALDDAADSNARSRTDQKHHAAATGGGGLPGWLVSAVRWGGPPVLVIALLCALIVGAKAMRRRRRRTRGTPAARLAKGWTEIVDHARDLGTAMPGGRTRRKQAGVLAAHDVTGLARAADARVFGADDPHDGDVADFWRQVSDTRKRMSRTVGLRRRAVAAVSLASFRRAPAGDAR